MLHLSNSNLHFLALSPTSPFSNPFSAYLSIQPSESIATSHLFVLSSHLWLTGLWGSQNHLGWRRSLGSSGATVNFTLPNAPLNRAPNCQYVLSKNNNNNCIISCCGLMLPWCQAPTKAAPSFPSAMGKRRDNITKGSWFEIRTRRDHPSNTTMGKIGFA